MGQAVRPLKTIVLCRCYFVFFWLVFFFLFLFGFCLGFFVCLLCLFFGGFFGVFFVLLFCKDRALRAPHDVLSKVTGGAKCVFVGFDS